MKVYLDYIFIENFLISIVCLSEVKLFTESRINVKRLFIGSAISGIYILLIVFLKISILNICIMRLLLPNLIIYVVFLTKSLKELFKKVVIYWLVNILNLGTIYTIQNIINIQVKTRTEKVAIYILTFSLSYVFARGIKIISNNRAREEKLYYKVKINFKEDTFNFLAFLDTGNMVFSYYKKMPVIFAKRPKRLHSEMLNKIENTQIVVNTINRKTIETGYVFRKIQIYKDEKMERDAIVVFLENDKFDTGKYDMILNPRIF